MKNRLLNCEDDEEAKDDDKLCHRVVEINLVLVFDLLQHFFEALLHIRKEVKKTRSYEDPTGEAGRERYHKTPPKLRQKLSAIVI